LAIAFTKSGRGKSELHRARCHFFIVLKDNKRNGTVRLINSMESATENIPPGV